MFERCTEKARRVLFFARYEAVEFGSGTIESEHFLLGMLKEDNSMVLRFAPDWPSFKEIVREITNRVTIGEKLAASVDLPLSIECTHILRYAGEEAELMSHRKISTEHLLLGMLRATNSLAAEILRAHGLSLVPIREQIALGPEPQDVRKPPQLPEAGCVPDPETAMRIAEAVWIPLYGEDMVKQQRPLQADLTASVWTVRGSPPPEQAAVTLVAFISRTDGRILKVGTSFFRREFPGQQLP